jgi:hypothetical protein
MVGGCIPRQTDWWEEFREYTVEMGICRPIDIEM